MLQDKTCCLGPHSVKAMLNEGDDIIHTNVGNGWTTAHLATLTNQDNTTIYAFGIKDDEHLEMLEARMGRLRIHSILKYDLIVLLSCTLIRSMNHLNSIIVEGYIDVV